MAPSFFFLKTVGKLLYMTASLLQLLTSSVKLLESKGFPDSNNIHTKKEQK